MKGYRTIAFNVLMAIVAVTGANVAPEQVETVVTVGALIWAAGNAALRAVTNTKIGKKE